MKIVIEVSEKDYLNFLLQYKSGILDEKTPSHRAKIAIAKGIVLPNGHGRLIDADALKEDMCRYGWSHIDSTIHEYVDDFPTIIEADKVAR